MDLAAWFQELRRRRVIRALLAWGLVSFAVLQVVEPVQHALGLAEWVLKAVVAVLAIGFPVTAGLAWAFDLTRKGVERTEPPEGADAASARRARAGPAVTLVVGALLGAAVAGFAGWHLWGRVPAPGPDGRITIVVADFANETKDPDLDGLSGLLITSLEQSKKFRVLTRSRMIDLLRQMGRDKAERIDEALARDVGAKAGATALLLASVRKLDDVYAVEMRALDPSRDEYLFTVREQARGKRGLLEVIDRLSDRARIEFREPQTEIQANEVNVAQAVTPSLDAYRHYFQGLERKARFEDEGALKEFQAALAIEPRFALALLEVAEMDALYLRESKGTFEQAASNAGALPVKERGLVLAGAAYRDGRQADAAAIMEPLALRFPDDRFVAQAAGVAAGCPQGIAHLRRALAFAPEWDPVRTTLVFCLVEQGRAEEAIGEADAAERARPTSASATNVALVRYQTGDVDGAIAAAQRAGDRGHTERSRGILISALATRGDFQAARALARESPDHLKYHEAIVPAALGQLRECLANLEAFERSKGTYLRSAERFRRAVVSAALGKPPGPGSVAPPSPPLDDSWNGFITLLIRDPEELAAGVGRVGAETYIGRMYQALLTYDRGNRAGALQQLQSQDPRPGDLQLYYLGLFASELGHDEEAIAAFQQYELRNRPYIQNIARAWLLARGRYLTARSLERLGRRDEARRVLELQLARWKDADSDLPLLGEMKALCRQLDCKAPGGVSFGAGLR
jgi:tetratricopeptide (TPR) repeat protein